MRVFVPAQVQSNQDREKTDFATLTLNFYKITKVNLATENMEMLLFFKFWRLQDMSFATALNMICNTQKHALKLIKKEKRRKKIMTGLGGDGSIFLYSTKFILYFTNTSAAQNNAKAPLPKTGFRMAATTH